MYEFSSPLCAPCRHRVESTGMLRYNEERLFIRCIPPRIGLKNCNHWVRDLFEISHPWQKIIGFDLINAQKRGPLLRWTSAVFLSFDAITLNSVSFHFNLISTLNLKGPLQLQNPPLPPSPLTKIRYNIIINEIIAFQVRRQGGNA